MGKILAGKVSDITHGKMIKIEADGKDILVTNVDGNYYAMDDTCLLYTSPSPRDQA